MSAPHHSPFDRVHPVGLVVFGVASIQFGAALAATMFDDLGPGGTSFLRLGLAALVMALIWRPRWSRHSREEIRLVVALGLMLGGMNYAFYEALDRVPLGIAVTIEFVGPLGVAVFTSRRRLDLAWAALAAGGIVLLARPGGDGVDPIGLVLIFVAAACWAGYILLAQRAGQLFGGARGLAMAMAVAFLIPLVPGVYQAGTQLLAPEFLLMGLGVALMSSVVPYTLETEALRRLPTHVFGVLMSLEPAVACLAGFLILGQSLAAVEIAAIALVVAASVGVTRMQAVPNPGEG